MVSVPVLTENKPWIVSADALHCLTPVSREVYALSCPSPPVFLGMPLLLRSTNSAEVLVLQK